MSESMTPESIHTLSTSVARLERRCRRLAALVVGCLVVLATLIGTSFATSQERVHWNNVGNTSIAVGSLSIIDSEQRPRIRLSVDEDAASGGSAVFEMLDTKGEHILSLTGHAWGASDIRVGYANRRAFAVTYEPDPFRGKNEPFRGKTEIVGPDGTVLFTLDK